MGSETIKNKFTSEEIYYALHVVFLFGVLTIIYLHFNATARFVLSPETLQYDVPYLQQLTMNLLMDLTAVFLFGSSLPISPKKYGYLRLISLNLAIICFVSYQNLVPLEMYIRFDLLYFPVLIIGSLILILRYSQKLWMEKVELMAYPWVFQAK